MPPATLAMPKVTETTMPAMTLGFVAGEGRELAVVVAFGMFPARRNSSAGSLNPLGGRVFVAPPLGLFGKAVRMETFG